ncbi:MAG: NAD(P)-dependent malic enzyme [Planctomycetota bacterium]|jgi:malate dehydrogenase (oxaloacetate-decarboxylating)
MHDFQQRSLEQHEQHHGKMAIVSKVPLETRDDLSTAYTPGVAKPCEVIAADPARAWDLTIKRNTIAIVTDGSAVLGLGNIGPEAALPVMEGKAILFKEFGDIDAWPICLDTNDPDEIVRTVRNIAPGFGGINLEDIKSPQCFEIEDRLQDLGIPVFHDDQHGTAIVLLAGLLNASKVTGKPISEMRVVISGAGAAGIAIAEILGHAGHEGVLAHPVGGIIACDTRGAVHSGRTDLNDMKRTLLSYTNHEDRSGTIHEVLRGADVFVGVSVGGLLGAEDIRAMADYPIILAMANPTPEIAPEVALDAGAAIVGTGRSDYPNQINNVLAFPGIFRGALDARAPRITRAMKLAAAHALSECVESPTAEQIIPDPLDKSVATRVAQAVQQQAMRAQAAAV